MNDHHHPLYGVLLILLSGLLLASHDGLAKHLSEIYPVFLVIWARYVAQTVLMTALFVPRMGQRVFRTLRPWPQLLRGLSLVSVSLLFINGLHFIPLAEATAVIFLTPVLVTIASALLGERVSRSQWLAVGFGLLGVVIIVRPGSALFTPAVLLPFGAALSFTVYQLVTRRLAGTDHPVTSNYLTSLVGCVTLSVLVVFAVVLGFRVQTDPVRFLIAVALMVLFGLCLCWVSVFVGMLVKSPQAVPGTMVAFILPLTFGSNVFVPSATMPGWLQAWVNINPVTLLADAARGLLLGGEWVADAGWAFVWAVGIAGVFFPLALRAYRRRMG